MLDQTTQQNATQQRDDEARVITLPSAEDIFLAVKSNNVDKLQKIVSFFIEHNENPIERFNSARTLDADSLPLVSYALFHKAKDAFCFLLNTSGKNENDLCMSTLLVDEANWNALHHAVESNNIEAVKILLDSVSNSSSGDDDVDNSSPTSRRSTFINQRTTEDWFPLTFAICNGNVEIVKMLLQVPEIDIESTVDDMSHKEIAEQRKYSDIVKMLEEKERK